MKRILLLPVLLSLAVPSVADSISYMRVHKPLIEAHLKLEPAGATERIKTLRQMLQKGGCPQVLEQAVPREELPNLICVLPGEEEGTIVVSASLDYAAGEDKDAARWSTLTMLPLLAESLTAVRHRFTIILAAFTGREHGIRGAEWYLGQLTDVQRKPIQAMIDLDNLGKTPPVYALAQSDKTLAKWLQVAAFSLQVPTPALVDASTPNVQMQNGNLAVREEDLWANAKPFERQHIPAISVQSEGPAMLPALRQSGAMPERFTGADFDVDAYEDTYRLMCVYVLYLDRNLGRPLVEPGIYSGKIVDTAGVFSSSPIELSAKIGRFTSASEMNRYAMILQKGGQDALADALANENEKGNYRFGLSLSYGAKIVAMENTSEAPHIWLVGTRTKQSGSASLVGTQLKQPGGSSQNFRFTAIKLMLDGKGNGDGLFYNAVKLRFNKKHEIEIEDFGSKPDDIRNVKLEQTTLPRTIPMTAVASVETPANTPASGAAPAAQAAGNATASATAPVASGTAPVPGPAAVTTVASASVPQDVNAPKAAAPPESGVATFQTQAQLVQLDVSVTDSSGRPIAGLQQSDFTVLEDGQPQAIRVFETHLPNTEAAAKSAAAPKLTLPPHTFTNQVAAPPEGPLSILLVDLWNTPLPDQTYARKQTIQFLKSLPPGKTIAMYVLGSRLALVQGFSDDPATLVASAERVMNERSLLLRPDGERQAFQGQADSVARFAMPSLPSNAPAGAAAALASGDAGIDLGSAKARQRTDGLMEADRTAQRVFTTLSAILIAGALAV